jgi:hypothetical protein
VFCWLGVLEIQPFQERASILWKGWIIEWIIRDGNLLVVTLSVCISFSRLVWKAAFVFIEP